LVVTERFYRNESSRGPLLNVRADVDHPASKPSFRDLPRQKNVVHTFDDRDPWAGIDRFKGNHSIADDGLPRSGREQNSYVDNGQPQPGILNRGLELRLSGF
jgi:hypothetical protein